MKVERLIIDNVQAIGSAEIELGALTVLVGPNGIGKTTALRCLRWAMDGEPLSWPGTVRIRGRTWTAQLDGRTATSDLASLNALAGPVYLRLDPSQLELTSPIPRGHRFLGDQGFGLAGAISRLILERPDLRDLVADQLRAVVPGFRAVRSRPVAPDVFELRFDFDHVADVPQNLVSTGTLTSLALLVLVHAERPANRQGLLALIDDPETGLHPGAQEELTRKLVAVAEHDEVQIVLATHSPYVVDAAGAQNVWVFGRRPDGRSVARRLTDHPDASRSLNVLTAGEFWGAVGEDWVGKAS